MVSDSPDVAQDTISTFPDDEDLDFNPPTPNEDPLHSDTEFDTDSSDTETFLSNDRGSMISEDEDVPEHATENALLLWLRNGSQELKELVRQGKLTLFKKFGAVKRGKYHTTVIGKAPAPRTVRYQKQQARKEEEKDNKENERLGMRRTKVTDFFNTPALRVQSVPDTDIEILDTPAETTSVVSAEWDSFGIEIGEDEIEDPDSQPGGSDPSGQSHRTTIEEVEDEEFMDRDALAEEGLLDDDIWDPSTETLPYENATQGPLSSQTAPMPGPINFTKADNTFDPASDSSSTGRKHNVGSQIPSNTAVDQGIKTIQDILHPPRKTGRGYKNPVLNPVLRGRLELMLGFLRLYRAQNHASWRQAAETMAKVGGKGEWLARMLCQWSIEICENPSSLPTAKYGKHNACILEDEDIAGDIRLHLRSLGTWICAADIVRYVATPEFQARLKVKKTISERTARSWMKRMGYKWKNAKKGMYADGHEREDVVNYRQDVFLPRWRAFEAACRWWNKQGEEEGDAKERAFIARADGKIVVIWRHDESTYYANDRRKLRWEHESETATPYAKGEGSSLMVGDFASPDYGWLKGKDGSSLLNIEKGS
jgi:hypothetical protein